MDMSSMTATIFFLIADDGRLLTNGFVAVKSVAVPSQEYASEWREIDEAEWAEPSHPLVSEEVRQATAAIINRIAELVLNYDAIEEAKALDNFNIENLLALAKAKNVTPEDMALLKEDLVLLKTDLEGKMDATWYQIWNGWLKGAIAEALRNMAKNRSAAK